MHFIQMMKLGLAFVGFCTLGNSACPAEAQLPGQLEKFTLSGVTFADGATASGYFIFNGALAGTSRSELISAINITTTNGITDSVAGTQYGDYGYYLDSSVYGGHAYGFVVDNVGLQGQQSGQLFLIPATSINFNSSGTNIIPLVAGFNSPVYGASGSSETTSGTRQLVSGFLIETPAAVPEASTTVSFGLLLALGLGGAAVAARKKKATV